ncbi:MAG: YfhO family protein [Anaerolineae bacterium]|nr:YfhO family protein [Anaerolineae bacterium]
MLTRREIPRWFPFTLLIAALIALFHPLLRGETLFWGLPSLQFYPWRQFAFDELSAGHLPSWNPYLGAGAPLLANYQTAIFYPPNWLYLLLPGTFAMSVIALLHIVWAGLGMWLFAGALKIPTFGRGISTLAYALTGYLIARLGSFPTANAGAWLPWLFWLAQRVITGRKWRDVGWLALALALQLLAGHAQTVWYGGVGLGLYALWLAFWSQREQLLRLRVMALVLIGIGVVLGVLIAAVQLLPTAEFLLESQRSGGLDYKTLTNFSYHPLRLFTLLSPDFFGTPADGSFLTDGSYFEDAAYIGFIPLVAAIAVIVARTRQRKQLDANPLLHTVPVWIGLALFGFFLAMGRYNPFYRTLAEHVPTFDTFRDPARWLILTVFSLSVLAGIGVQYWGRGKWIVFWSRLATAGGGGMALMAFVGITFMDLSDTLAVLAEGMMVLGLWTAGAAILTLIQPDPAISPAPISPFLWRIAVLLFVVIDLGWMASGLNPTVPDEYFDVADRWDEAGRIYWFDDYEQAVTFGADDSDGFFAMGDYTIAAENWQTVRDSRLPNINMLDRVPSLNNNDPLLPQYHSAYIDLIEELGAESGALLRAAGVTHTYGIAPEGWTGENPAVVPVADEIALAWLVPQAEIYESDDASAAVLRDPGWNPLETIILAGEVPESGKAKMTSGNVTLSEDSPTEKRYQVTTDGAAYLVISETWYPGWSAQIDGETTTLYRANLAFQAVRVPAGEHEITVSYTLNHWRTGAAISVVSLIAALVLMAWGTINRRR